VRVLGVVWRGGVGQWPPTTGMTFQHCLGRWKTVTLQCGMGKVRRMPRVWLFRYRKKKCKKKYTKQKWKVRRMPRVWLLCRYNHEISVVGGGGGFVRGSVGGVRGQIIVNIWTYLCYTHTHTHTHTHTTQTQDPANGCSEYGLTQEGRAQAAESGRLLRGLLGEKMKIENDIIIIIL